jgi:hypothetical protein
MFTQVKQLQQQKASLERHLDETFEENGKNKDHYRNMADMMNAEAEIAKNEERIAVQRMEVRARNGQKYVKYNTNTTNTKYYEYEYE